MRVFSVAQNIALSAPFLASLLAPFWTPENIEQINISARFQNIGLLGTDHLGRDNLSLLMTGGLKTISLAAAVVSVSLLAGVIGGGLCAFASKKNPCVKIFHFWMNGFFSVPVFASAICLSGALGKGFATSVAAISLFFIPVMSRVIEDETRAWLKRDFIYAAICLGLPRRRIFIFHILPNISGLLISKCATIFSVSVLIDAGLNYLGVSADPLSPVWGRMIADAQQFLFLQPTQILYPFIAILILSIAARRAGYALAAALGAYSRAEASAEDIAD